MSSTEFSISINDFNGPLDLLLHLIRTQELDIFDLPIVKITDQFLRYIEDLDPSLDSAGEYLYMAANLIKIKSRYLLPQVIDEGGEEVDPRLELAQSLMEYQRFTSVIDQMHDLHNQRGQLFTRPVAQIPVGVEVQPLSEGIQLSDLQNAFLKILKRRMDTTPKEGNINKEIFSVADKIHEIKNIFIAKPDTKVIFDDLFSQSKSQDEMITTFLAVLELAKEQQVFIEIKDEQITLVNVRGEEVE